MTTTNTTVVDPFERKPSMIVVRCVLCDDPWSWKHLRYYRVPAEVKILVVHQISSEAQMMDVAKAFARLKFLNVVYLDLNRNSLICLRYYKESVVRYNHLDVSPSELFVDQTSNLNGYKVYASCYFARPETTMFLEHKIHGRDFRWISETARHLNGSARIVKIDCEKGKVSRKECERRRQYRSNGKDRYEINLDPMHEDSMMPFAISAIEPDRDVIRVPRGQRLSILELFLLPFSLKVWMLLVLVIFVCCLAIHYFSGTFVNDPVLASLCGIEKISFYQTGTTEKLLTMALTILFFFLLRAYETKIITLMTSYPYKEDPRDLQDLHRMGIKIAFYEGYSDQFFMHNPELQALIEAFPANTSAHLSHAEIGEETLINVIVTMTNCFHRKEIRPRYVILKNYQPGSTIRQFWMAPRSPLARELLKSQRIFFEAGIRRFLLDQVLFLFHLRSQIIMYREQALGMAQEEDELLQAHELIPAWYVLLYGLVFSGFVCIGEIILKKYWISK